MRIVEVVSYFPSHLGGIEIVAWKLSDALAARGHSVDWIACGESAWPADRAGLTSTAIRFFDPLDTRFGLPAPIWHPADIVRVAHRVRSSDVVHIHDVLYFGSIVAFLLASLWRRPVVFTVHVSRLRFRSRALRYLYDILTASVGRVLLGFADQVVFVGGTAQRYFASRVRFRRAPCVIENGVDRSVFMPLDPDRRMEERLRLGVPGDRALLLFVGRFVEKKGLELLHRAALAASSAHWIFVGEGPIDPRNWQLTNVAVVPRVPPERLAVYYQCADLLLSPGVGEGGVPLVVREALACGTPVFVSDEIADALPALPCVRRVGVDGEQPGERVAELLKGLCADPRALATARDEAIAVSEPWDWSATAARYEQVFTGVLGGREPSS